MQKAERGLDRDEKGVLKGKTSEQSVIESSQLTGISAVELLPNRTFHNF